MSPRRWLLTVVFLVSCGAGPSPQDGGAGGGQATGGGVATGGGDATGGGVATGGGEATGGGLATGGGTSTGGGTATGGGASTGGGTATGGGAATGGGTGASTVTFAYRPSWAGVTAVTVVGGFHMTTDWSSPLLSLADDGTGTFRGSIALPDGTYPYLFVVTGDASTTRPLKRFVVDPRNPDAAICPSGSPTVASQPTNPCSTLTVPVPATAPPRHLLTGTVTTDDAGVSGYLVVVERLEPGMHHFFADRTTTDGGSYAFEVAPGNWRLQVLHPTFLTLNDAQRDPFVHQAQRRAISSKVTVGGPFQFPPVEMAFHQYGHMSPWDGGWVSLPLEFHFERAPWAIGAHVSVYGTGNDGGAGGIGDPWFASKNTDGGVAVFDGGFTTAQANEPSVHLGERYFWGTGQLSAARGDAGVTWSTESMVFPVYFH